MYMDMMSYNLVLGYFDILAKMSPVWDIVEMFCKDVGEINIIFFMREKTAFK